VELVLVRMNRRLDYEKVRMRTIFSGFPSRFLMRTELTRIFDAKFAVRLVADCKVKTGNALRGIAWCRNDRQKFNLRTHFVSF